jgi:hypothetical protein
VVFLFIISEYAIMLEGKVALYKRGFHVLRRQVKRIRLEREKWKKEVRRLRDLLQLHEDVVFYALEHNVA